MKEIILTKEIVAKTIELGYPMTPCHAEKCQALTSSGYCAFADLAFQHAAFQILQKERKKENDKT